MAQATDFTIANQSFPDFRTDLNTVLGAINSSNSGTSRPSSATTGTFWLDTTNSGSNLLVLKFFDGSDHFKHSELLIELIQDKFWKLCTKKLIVIKVNDHLQAFVIVTSALVNW